MKLQATIMKYNMFLLWNQPQKIDTDAYLKSINVNKVVDKYKKIM